MLAGDTGLEPVTSFASTIITQRKPARLSTNRSPDVPECPPECWVVVRSSMTAADHSTDAVLTTHLPDAWPWKRCGPSC